MIFNIINKNSFDELDFWIKKIKEDSNEKSIILLGNQIDLEYLKKVNKDIAKKYSEKKKIKYYEISTNSRDGIKIAFEVLYKDLLKKKSKGKEQDCCCH